MSETNNAEKIRDWLRSCPYASDANKYFGVDYIGENADQFAVFSVTSTLKYKTNILGERYLQSEQTQSFDVVMRAPYGNDVTQNLENLRVAQNMVSWIREQNEISNFPEWNDGEIKFIDATNTGAPMRVSPDSALYEFSIKVTYKVKQGE